MHWLSFFIGFGAGFVAFPIVGFLLMILGLIFGDDNADPHA